MTVNLLNLPSWEIESVDETRQSYRVRARYAKPPAYCPACGVADPGVHRFGKRENVFADLPHHGKRTEIVVERQRYRCKECGSAFLEPLPDMDPDHDATQRMVSWIEQQALRRPFAQVAKEVEVGESTVRRIFLAFTARMNAQYRAKAPKWLGIDEIHLLGRPRAVFTNIQRRYLIDMLEDRSQSVVTNYLMHLPRREQTEVVAIDMWRPYKTAVNAAMPQASVVIDKFHVVRTATSGLEGVRKSVRKGLNSRQRVQLKNDRFLLLRRASKLKPNEQMILDAWCGAFPDLYLAWELKETFYAIYDAPSKEEARDRMRAWPATVPKHLAGKSTLPRRDHRAPELGDRDPGVLGPSGHQRLHRVVQQPDPVRRATGPRLQLRRPARQAALYPAGMGREGDGAACHQTGYAAPWHPELGAQPAARLECAEDRRPVGAGAQGLRLRRQRELRDQRVVQPAAGCCSHAS
jgi:transposase